MNSSTQLGSYLHFVLLLLFGLSIFVLCWILLDADLTVSGIFIALVGVVEGVRRLIFRPASPLTNEPAKVEDEERMRKTSEEEIAFPAKVVGSIFHIGDDVTAVVGDIEIPSKTTVSEILVVKGRMKIGENCRMLRNVKAMKDVHVGANTRVDGNIVSGGRVTVQKGVMIKGKIDAHGGLSIAPGAILKSSIIVQGDVKIYGASEILGDIIVKSGKVIIGPDSVIYGSIECDENIKIDKYSVVKGNLYSKSSVTLHKDARVCQAVKAEGGVYVRTYVKRGEAKKNG